MTVNFDNKPQPASDLEKGAVAREVMGLDTNKTPEHRAPRFHRLSIAAASNGATIDHEHKPKPIKTSGDSNPSKSPATPDYSPSHAEPYLVHADHPIMKHINAIHDEISKDCPGCHE